MSEYDLTSTIGGYLDRHLVFPLLEFLTERKIYDETDLLNGKLDLLSNTNMVDFAVEVHNALYDSDDAPEELRHKRNEVVSQLKALRAESDPVCQMFLDSEVQAQMKNARDVRQLVDYLREKHNFKPEMSDTIYNFAKFQYDCGKYEGAAEYLGFYRMLVSPMDKNYLNGLWGKLASEILMQNMETALEDLNRLKDYLENQPFTSQVESLIQRTWLLHWSLFVFFNHAKGKDLIIDLFLYQQQYLNAIQTMAPHLLRYLAAAVITNKQHRRAVMKDLIKVIQQESYACHDPITEFLEHLYANFDFDGAQRKLRECETVLRNDFFLVGILDDFIENARLMIFETFCRIHQCISIEMLAEKLNMERVEAEHWIVNLIRNAHLDAKIDSKLGHVVMDIQAVSPYHQLIEKTKQLSIRTSMQTIQIERRLNTMKADATWGAQPDWGGN